MKINWMNTAGLLVLAIANGFIGPPFWFVIVSGVLLGWFFPFMERDKQEVIPPEYQGRAGHQKLIAEFREELASMREYVPNLSFELPKHQYKNCPECHNHCLVPLCIEDGSAEVHKIGEGNAESIK